MLASDDSLIEKVEFLRNSFSQDLRSRYCMGHFCSRFKDYPLDVSTYLPILCVSRKIVLHNFAELLYGVILCK
jgi:hypothetical protein